MSTNKVDGVYPMKKDEEVKRLANQHEVIKDAMGKLLFAKVDISSGPLRILDSGTADGGCSILACGLYACLERTNTAQGLGSVTLQRLPQRNTNCSEPILTLPTSLHIHQPALHIRYKTSTSLGQRSGRVRLTLSISVSSLSAAGLRKNRPYFNSRS
jgi:hypothetical protein